MSTPVAPEPQTQSIRPAGSPRTVDRRLAQAIAYKRMFTGTIALGAGAALIQVVAAHGAAFSPLVILALAIFAGGGGWALRDGLRLHRDLQR